MSLFLSVETRSKLLGSKTGHDKVLIPVNSINKIESFNEEEGCVITYGTGDGRVERVISSISVRQLLNDGVVDFSKFSK